MDNETVEFLERRIRERKTSLIESADWMILSLQGIQHRLEAKIDIPSAYTINGIGELQASATMFDAKCGYLAGLVESYNAIQREEK